MRLGCLTALLLATVAVAQAAENVTPKSAPAPGGAPQPVNTAQAGAMPKPAAPAASGDVKLSPNDPVIVVAGLCDPVAAAPAKHKTRMPCKTVVTRAQFDALADAIQPHMDPVSKAQLAASYPQLLLMQREFRRRSLDNDVKVKQMIAFAKLRAEADEAEKALKVQAGVIPEAEIQRYYNENLKQYEQTELLRLYIPYAQNDKQGAHHQQGPMNSNEPGKDDAARPLADSLHDRAAAGENFDNLQVEAYRVAGLTSTPPDTNIGKHTADDMSEDHRKLISMAVGEVSPVMKGPNGYYIYKVLSKDTRPIEKVHAEINSALTQVKIATFKKQMDLSVHTQFNSDYFLTDPLTVNAAIPSGNVLGQGGKAFAARGGHGSLRRTVPAQVMPAALSPAAAAAPAPGNGAAR